MRISSGSAPPALRPAPWVLLAGALLFPTPLASQFPTYLLDQNTEVQSIRFRFLGSGTFKPSQLLDKITLTQRGKAYGFKSSFSFLPFVPDPTPHPFDPLGLQRDVARIRDFYQREGFPEVEVRYEVSLDQGRNLVGVEFLIREGRPRTLASISVLTASGTPLAEVLAPEIVPSWRDFLKELGRSVGDRLGEVARAQLVGAPLRWLMERGYPFPTGASEVELDSEGFLGDLKVQIDPGPRSRVSSLRVQGVESVDPTVILREVPIREGDWYTASRVSQGRQRVATLGLFRVVTAEVIPPPGADSTAQVLFRVREGRPRSLSGFLGYTNVGGLSFGGEWEHRNFWGGARTFSVNGTAETGVLAALTDVPDQYYRGSVSLRQPYLLVPGLSALISPFGEYRDDYRDRSWEGGADGTLVYQIAPLRAVSLRARVSNREVLEYRLGDAGMDPSGGLDIGEIVDSLEGNILVSALTLSGTFEDLDDPVNPRDGFVLQPSMEVTAPLGFPTNEYLKAEVWGSLFRSLGDRFSLAANVRAGRIFPFGRSVPSPDSNGLLEALQLRDVSLTAGGPVDVRGWGSRLLGPKIPYTESRLEGDSLVYFSSRYLPMGGLARISGGIELRLPLLGPVSSLEGHLFLDGGRVWTPDDRYPRFPHPFDQTDVYYSAGGGVGIRTPVGPIRLTVGYKLNPSPLDLRDPGEVYALLREGESVLDAKVKDSRRFQFHLTVGRAF